MHTSEIRPLRSYRATLVPKDLDFNQVESEAVSGRLPTIQLKAASLPRAKAAAEHVTGLPVVQVEQVGPDHEPLIKQASAQIKTPITLIALPVIKQGATSSETKRLVDQFRAGEAEFKLNALMCSTEASTEGGAA